MPWINSLIISRWFQNSSKKESALPSLRDEDGAPVPSVSFERGWYLCITLQIDGRQKPWKRQALF